MAGESKPTVKKQDGAVLGLRWGERKVRSGQQKRGADCWRCNRKHRVELYRADLPLDLRDIALDFWNWEWSWGHAGETLLDLATILPVVGLLKNGKKLSSMEELATEVSKAGGFKHYNTAANSSLLKKLSNGTFEIVDESGKVIKRRDNFPSVGRMSWGLRLGKARVVRGRDKPRILAV